MTSLKTLCCDAVKTTTGLYGNFPRGGHPLLKTTLTGLRRTYLRFLVFRPKLTKTKRFPPFLDHMNGKLFLGGSRFWSGKIGPKLALGGHRSQCPAELSFIFNRCPAGNPLFLTDNIYFWQIFTKFHNFRQISQFRPNFTISTKFHNFN